MVLRSRVSLFINVLKFFYRVMSVDLSGRKVSVTQYLFDGVQISSIVEHMSGEGVSQDVRTFFTHGSYLTKVVINLSIYKFWIEAFTLIGE